MVDWILSQQADFVLIQEFFNDDRSVYFNNLSRLMESGQYQDYYFINRPRHDNGVRRGLVILSAHPLHHKRELFLGENRFNGAQAVVAEVNGKHIELVNVHLKSSALRPSKNVRSLSGMRKREAFFQ
jgi:endonuclease/exonuclease/phosphatase family metal-dependent hydrolase